MYILYLNKKTNDYFVKYQEFWFGDINNYVVRKNRFGIKKYAEIWRDYYNKKIDQQELRNLLEL